jgi:hypothetical protein
MNRPPKDRSQRFDVIVAMVKLPNMSTSKTPKITAIICITPPVLFSCASIKRSEARLRFHEPRALLDDRKPAFNHVEAAAVVRLNLIDAFE